MLRRTSSISIPFELHKIKAQQIYEKRIAEGRGGSRESDWQKAETKLLQQPWRVMAWKIKKLFLTNLNLDIPGYRRLLQSFSALIDEIWKVITFPLWLFYRLPQLFANSDTRLFALDVVKTIISAASLIAAIIAAIGLFFNYQDAIQDRQLNQERLITDRFTQAVGQIGHNEEQVVIGGIYSLERIAKDSYKDQWTIMEFLTAFVRTKSPILPAIQELKDKPEEKRKVLKNLNQVSLQVQTALTVIGRNNPNQNNTQEDKEIQVLDLSFSNLNNYNLTDANLIGINLNNADLNNANLTNANLTNANLTNANLTNANLTNANLTNANLTNANLTGATLIDATLKKVKLRNVDLNRARLTGFNLTDAYLSGAYLKSTYLDDTNLSNARLNDANLSNAYLRNANLSNADLRRVDLTYANLNNANLAGSNLRNSKLSGSYLSNANLTGAYLIGSDLNNTQIKLACFWEEAIYATDSNLKSMEKERQDQSIVIDEPANKRKIEELRQDKNSDPQNPPNCKRWE